MRAAITIATKDLRERLRDRTAILIAVVVPLGLAAVFAVTLADVTGGSVTFEYAVVDLDRGDLANVFTDQVLGSLEEDGLIELRTPEPETEAEGRALAADGTVDATFVIPAGFSAATRVGGGPVLLVIGNVDARIGSEVAGSIARSFTRELVAVQLSVATAATAIGDPEIDLDALSERAARVAPPIAIDDVSTSSRELDANTFYAAGMSVFFLFFTVQFGVSSMLDERRDGTLARLLAAPIPRAAILGGKLLTSFVLGVASMIVLVLATALLLGAKWGDPLGVLLLIIAGVLAATGIMAVVATFARTAEQAGYMQAIIAVVLGMLGGSFFPVSLAGGLIERLSLLTPHAWFLRGLGDLAGGGGADVALSAALPILAFAAISWLIAMLRLDRLLST